MPAEFALLSFWRFLIALGQHPPWSKASSAAPTFLESGALSENSKFAGFPRHPSCRHASLSSFLMTRSNSNTLPSAAAVCSAA